MKTKARHLMELTLHQLLDLTETNLDIFLRKIRSERNEKNKKRLIPESDAKIEVRSPASKSGAAYSQIGGSDRGL